MRPMFSHSHRTFDLRWCEIQENIYHFVGASGAPCPPADRWRLGLSLVSLNMSKTFSQTWNNGNIEGSSSSFFITSSRLLSVRGQPAVRTVLGWRFGPSAAAQKVTTV